MKSNIFKIFVQQLKVKYTDYYIDKYYEEHPHQNSLYGLSQMCFHYGIDNEVLQVESEDTLEINMPFISYLNNDFIVIRKMGNEIQCYSNEKEFKMSIDDYLKQSTGIIILVENTEDSIEPDFKLHKKIEIFNQLRKVFLFFILIILFLSSFFYSKIYTDKLRLYSFTINLMALLFSFLLLRKELNINDKLSNYICSYSKGNNCNAVLNSNASKLAGLISWSEIGFSFFLSNTFVILLFYYLHSYYGFFITLALPYTIWSIWYQKKQIKQWCPLCICVQISVWIAFFINLYSMSFKKCDLNFILFTDALIIYLLPLLSISIICSELRNKYKNQYSLSKLRKIKNNKNVFDTLLYENSFYNINKHISNAYCGNLESKNVITIILNPFCEPCSFIHNKLHEILRTNTHICIQYVFMPLDPSNEYVCRFLIAAYNNNTISNYLLLLDEWFYKGKFDAYKFVSNYKYDLEGVNVTDLYDNQKLFFANNKISKTPTILLNGYNVPEEYEMNDLIAFV